MFGKGGSFILLQGGGSSPLAMVDDLACITNCGIETVKTNAYINAKTNLKKLQFGPDKCHKIRGQTDRGYKKTEPDPDICNLLFVSFKRNRIFQNCYPLRY